MTDDTTDEDLDALIARSLTARGELIPTTVEEVLEAETDDVELPASLESFRENPSPPAARRPRAVVAPRPVRALVYTGALAASIAALWAFAILRPGPEPIAREATATTNTAPAARAAASEPPILLSQPTCGGQCCAGSECSSAKGELASCPTERTCIPCAGLDDPDTLYRVRVGDPSADASSHLTPAQLDGLDLCIRVGAAPSSEWACEPARAPSSVRPWGRYLKTASRAADLAGGVTMELRDGKTVRGRWWEIIKPSPKALCLGYKIGFENDRKEPVGLASMFLERTYYVEVAHETIRDDLERKVRLFSVAGLTPRIFPMAKPAVALAFGPFDRDEASRVLEEIRERAPEVLAARGRVVDGDDYYSW